MKSRNLNFLEPSGPLQACNGTALPLPLHCMTFTQRRNRLTTHFAEGIHVVMRSTSIFITYSVFALTMRQLLRHTSYACSLHPWLQAEELIRLAVDCLMGYDANQFYGTLSTFRRNVLPLTSVSNAINVYCRK